MHNMVKQISKITVPTPFPVGDVHLYLIKGDALTLVDAGVKTEQAWEIFQMELKSLGYTINDIDQVILTHHHPDHVGLLDYLPEHIRVLGHEKCERWINRTEPFLQEYRRFYKSVFFEYGVPENLFVNIRKMERTLKFSCNRSLNGYIEEGETVPGHPEWLVVETPGHAQSHIGLINEVEGSMIGGDLILATISSNPLLEPPVNEGKLRPTPLLQYNHSLMKIKNYNIQLVYPGHGKEVTAINSLIDRRIGRQHERAMQVREMLVNEPLTGFQICKLLFPQAYEKELNLTMSETIGQLDYLESINQIHIVTGDDGVNRFMATVHY